MNFSAFINAVAGSNLQALADFASDEYLDAIRYGDHYRWRRLLSEFPALEPSRVEFGETIRVGSASDGKPAQIVELEKLLREFIPWRKGPFDLFGIGIDSEWQSQIKWARLENAIAPLDGRRVLDVGSGNGYSSFRMYGAGAQLVVGLEPHIPYYGQFWAVKHYLPDAPVYVLPITLEKMPIGMAGFDTVFSMGVLYHRRSPIDHLLQLFDQLRPGGQLVMETIYVEGDAGYSLMPTDRYARMNNVWFLPSIPTLLQWLEKSGFINPRVTDESVTTASEQRQSDWMPYDSLDGALMGKEKELTIEGYPAPKRVIVLCEKPES